MGIRLLQHASTKRFHPSRRSFLKTSAALGAAAISRPLIVERGSGVRITDLKGRAMIDCGAGLWCVNVGYGRPEIAEAARDALPEAFRPAARGVVIRVEDFAWDEVLDELGKDDPMMDLAMELERIALEDEYFIEKKLYPNVDFYSGIIYKALGIPVSMFTVMFAIARTVGWVAQWLEQCETPTKIGRPRQVYAGPKERKYRALHRRG